MLKRTVQALENIARKHLHVFGFQVRRSDSLDFYNCSIWGIQAALEEAYKLGYAAGEAKSTRSTRK